MLSEKIIIKGKEYIKEKYLGKGKSGYSYLLKDENSKAYVLKKIHYEPCPYYSFEGNKVDIEINAYKVLKKLGIKIPELIDWDSEKNYLLKDYINGKTVAELIAEDNLEVEAFEDIFCNLEKLYKNKINLDYFPTNFVIQNGELYYVDYEFNEYTDEWNFENWGIYYWVNNIGMKNFLENGDHSLINISANSGKPISEPFEKKVLEIIKKHKVE